MSEGRTAVSAADVERAAKDLGPHLPATPLQYSPAFTAKAGCHVHLKIETVQPIRAFKVRGALNKILNLSPEERARGVITASAGNHGQGVAYAARAFGAPATVFVPENANRLKVEAIRRLGARVVQAGRNYDGAYREALRERERQGSIFVHAFDDHDVIAGQGTVGVEMLRELPEVDTVLVPVGGGGLIAGIATHVRSRLPRTRVVGVEPAGAACMRRSLEAGRPVALESVDTIADGLAASRPGELCFEIASRLVDEVVVVSDAEMLRAIRLLFEWEHLLTEPAGAAAVAALLHHHRTSSHETVAAVVSGANVTDEVMIRALTGGRQPSPD
ncbi:MAG: threonine ammonia-lyase [Candidatus Dormibacteraceae bacterium]